MIARRILRRPALALLLMAATIAAAFSAAAAVTAAAHDENDLGPEYDVYKVTKSGTVTIREDATVAGSPLKKGHYRFMHRIDERRHIVTLDRLGEISPSYDIVTSVVPEPRAPKVSQLVLKEFPDRSRALVLIAVAGEVGDHLPQSAETR